MRDCGGYIPPLMCQMVEIREKTGHLDDVLLRLAKYYEQQVSMQRTFWFGSTWRGFQLVMGIVVIGAVIWLPAADMASMRASFSAAKACSAALHTRAWR